MEGVVAFDEDMREEEEARVARVVFVEPAEYATGEELAESGSGTVDALVGEAGLLAEEVDAVREEAVD